MQWNKFHQYCNRLALGALLLFTFIAPLNFGLPYTYNIDQGVPSWNPSESGLQAAFGYLMELLFFNWPAEWGILILLATFVLWILSNHFERLWPLRFHPCDCLVGVWVCFIWCSQWKAGFHGPGMDTTLLFTTYGIYYCLIRALIQSQQRQMLLLGFGLAAYVTAGCYGFYQYFEGFEDTVNYVSSMDASNMPNRLMSRLMGEKVFSTFIYSNSYAGYLILWLPIVWGLMVIRPLRSVLVWGSLYGALFFTFILTLFFQEYMSAFFYLLGGLGHPISFGPLLFLTQSKGAILSLFIPVLGGLVFLGFRKRSLLFPVLAVVFLGLATWGYQSTVKTHLKLSGKVRMEYNTATWKIIQSAPWLGQGPGSYGTQYMHVKLPQAEEVQMAHNNFLQVWSEFGLVPFLSYLGIYGVAMMALWRRRNEAFPLRPFLLITLCVSVLHQAIDFDLYVPSLGWVLFSLLALAPERISESPQGLRQRRYLGWVVGWVCIGCCVLMAGKAWRIAQSSAWQQAGQKAIGRGEFDLAENHLEKTIQAYPGRTLPYILLARTRMTRGKSAAAERAVQAVLDISPDHAMTWYFYAQLLLEQGRRSGHMRQDDILTALQKAIKYYPEGEEIKAVYEKVLQDTNPPHLP